MLEHSSRLLTHRQKKENNTTDTGLILNLKWSQLNRFFSPVLHERRNTIATHISPHSNRSF
jgi:hypothetical protein